MAWAQPAAFGGRGDIIECDAALLYRAVWLLDCRVQVVLPIAGVAKGRINNKNVMISSLGGY